MKQKTIGFFGGTFDPIHFGHINLALEMLETHHLDEVLFCPAFCSPFKTQEPPIASPHHRLAMLHLSIQAIPAFRCTPIEIDRGGPSYTIDTIRSLQKEGSLRLLLADDAIDRFEHWKEAQELIHLAPPLIGRRKENSVGKGAIAEALKRGMTPTRIFEISSSEIRERMKKRLYCGHLVDAKILDYIETHHLYS